MNLRSRFEVAEILIFPKSAGVFVFNQKASVSWMPSFFSQNVDYRKITGKLKKTQNLTKPKKYIRIILGKSKHDHTNCKKYQNHY